MTPSARLSAAIEVLADLETHRRPATDALKDWGLKHRFAGSKDRAAIASLVYDTLRRKASAGWIMGARTPRAQVLGMMKLQRHLDGDAIAALCSGERFAPSPLTQDERNRLERASLDQAPPAIAGDCPEWIVSSLQGLFGDDTTAQLRALGSRAPLDIRINALKTNRAALKDALAHLSPEDTPHSPLGLRFRQSEDGRGPSLQAEPEFLQGQFEIQDEGSQLAALMSGAKPGETVIDLCAGAGGKTLALAAMMEGEGRLIATDGDLRRLAPIHDRIARSGAAIEVRTPRGEADPLADLARSADRVLIDAPCTGTGTWRRNPDAKWRLRPGSLAARLKEQAAVLARGAALVGPRGFLIYVTCSILPQENDEAIAGFLAANADFHPKEPAEISESFSASIHFLRHGVQLTPFSTGTDGFYVSVLRKG